MSDLPPFPDQPFVLDDGIVRFRVNRIVRFLLDAGPYDMNSLACMPFDDDERAQFAQLIGYTASGYEDLSYVSPEQTEKAHDAAEAFFGASQHVHRQGDGA